MVKMPVHVIACHFDTSYLLKQNSKATKHDSSVHNATICCQTLCHFICNSHVTNYGNEVFG